MEIRHEHRGLGKGKAFIYDNDHQEMDLLLKNNIWITFPVEYEQWQVEEDKKIFIFP